VKVCVDPASTSVAVNVPTVAFAALFSARLLADNAMSVGPSFTPVTLTTKLAVAVSIPSLTVTTNVSVVDVLNALIAASFGVNV
jgi:hypothetical protein